MWLAEICPVSREKWLSQCDLVEAMPLRGLDDAINHTNKAMWLIAINWKPRLDYYH